MANISDGGSYELSLPRSLNFEFPSIKGKNPWTEQQEKIVFLGTAAILMAFIFCVCVGVSSFYPEFETSVRPYPLVVAGITFCITILGLLGAIPITARLVSLRELRARAAKNSESEHLVSTIANLGFRVRVGTTPQDLPYSDYLDLESGQSYRAIAGSQRGAHIFVSLMPIGESND